MSEGFQKPEDFSIAVEKSTTAAAEAIERTFERFLDVANVKSVYAKPVQHGENLIIPAAEVLGAMGFGMGSGMGAGEGVEKQKEEGAENEEKPAEAVQPGPGGKMVGSGYGGGGGGGGGGHVFSRPVAVIIASPQGVHVEPVVDATKIALALFTALGFMFGMAARMRRGPHS
jgi:uncharacterized spore protein YtfJ